MDFSLEVIYSAAPLFLTSTRTYLESLAGLGIIHSLTIYLHQCSVKWTDLVQIDQRRRVVHRHGRVDLGQADQVELGDLFYGLVDDLAFQNPGDLLQAGLWAEVPGQDVLEVQWDVVLQEDLLILLAETGEAELGDGELGDQGRLDRKDENSYVLLAKVLWITTVIL